jgi:hypothetical protein
MDVRNLKKEIWPYQMEIRMPDVKSAAELLAPDKWCTEIIGLRFKDWYSYTLRDSQGRRVYAFRDEATLLVFKLTWGNYGVKATY